MIKKSLYLVLILIGVFSLYQTANAQVNAIVSPTTTAMSFTVTASCDISLTFPFDITQNAPSLPSPEPTPPFLYGGLFPDDSNVIRSPVRPNFNSSFGFIFRSFPVAINTTSNTEDGNNTVTYYGDNIAKLLDYTGGNYFLYYDVGFESGYAPFTLQYGQVCTPSSNISPFDPEQVSPIISNTKFTGATVQGASTTISFDVSYFLDTNEYTANTRPDLIQVLVGRDGFGQVALARKIILPLSDGHASATVPVNYNLPDTKEFIDGDYYAYVNFWNLQNDWLAFNRTNIVLNFTITNGLIVSQEIISITDGTEIVPATQYQDCSFSNIQGCLINAFIYVFVPAPNAFDKFLNLWERIEYKPPFGYVVGILDALNGLSNSATPAFSFGDIPFLDDLFTPFKNLLVIALWALYALFFMGRLSKLQL